MNNLERWITDRAEYKRELRRDYEAKAAAGCIYGGDESDTVEIKDIDFERGECIQVNLLAFVKIVKSLNLSKSVKLKTVDDMDYLHLFVTVSTGVNVITVTTMSEWLDTIKEGSL